MDIHICFVILCFLYSLTLLLVYYYIRKILFLEENYKEEPTPNHLCRNPVKVIRLINKFHRSVNKNNIAHLI